MASTKTGSRGYNPLDPPSPDMPSRATVQDLTKEPEESISEEEFSEEEGVQAPPELPTPIRGVPPAPGTASRNDLYSRPENFNINKAPQSDLMPADIRNARALGMDAEQIKALMTTKERLDSLEKVPVFLRPADKGEPNYREITINGYKAIVQRGKLVEVNTAVYERLVVSGEVDPRTMEDLLLVPVEDGRLIAARQQNDNGTFGVQLN